jgi:cytoskeleton protein RodZ
MSELGVNGPVDDIAEPRGVAGLTAGSMLRSAREAAGLHVAALAVAMKIPVKKLEALESDRLDLLHDAVFVRALAASVCRTLKIDSAPVLAKLPSNTLPRLNSDERGINAPFHPAGVKNGFSPSAVLNKPQALIMLRSQFPLNCH